MKNFVESKHVCRLQEFIAAYQKSPYARVNERGSAKSTPSPIDEKMIQEYENLIGMSLPPLFRAYLMAVCLPHTDLYVGQLPKVSPSDPFKWVERYSIEKMELPFYRRNKRLVPFTHGEADCSDMCFDSYLPDATGDYPIVKVWHERWYRECVEWSDLDCERFRAFSSFSGYLDYLQEWLIYRSSPREMNFEPWLCTRGKAEPPGY